MLLLAIVALGVPLAINLRARVNAEVRNQALTQTDLVAATAADLLTPRHRRELQTLAQSGARSVGGRVLIVDRSGAVLADSGTPAEVGVSYESRPEIESALAGHHVQVERSSKTLQQQILATAVPIIHDGRPAGAVRITQSVAAMHSRVRQALLGIVLIALIVLALGLVAGALIAAQVSRPLGRLEAVARRVAHGDLDAQAKLEGSREQRSLARSFNEMTERISRLLHVQREFVADASHQLRTPLTGLRLRLEEAKAITEGEADGVREAAAGAQLDAAIAEVDRLAHTVHELLVLSRAGERETQGAALDLAELAGAALARWSRHASEQGIGLERLAEGPAGLAWAARPDVERALDALLENALRYSPPGSTVTIATGPGRIEIRDRGPGIEEQERELVFERFHRGRAGRGGPPGSGLGLPIARELTREWGGEVRLESRPGGGAAAILSLPPRAPAAHPGADERFARS